MHHPGHKTMYAAYSYYTVANKHTLTQLMKDILIIAKQVTQYKKPAQNGLRLIEKIK